MNKLFKFKLNYNLLGKRELDGVIKVFKSGNVTQGKYCKDFEKKFAKKLNAKYALFVNSGSSANLLAFFCISNPLVNLNKNLKKKKFKNNSEIIICSLSWSTSLWPIIQSGAIPVFIDCNPNTLQIDEEQLIKAINKNTVAICIVHVLGNGPNIGKIKKICTKKKIWLIEDTCESLGAKYEKKKLGTFGDFGTFSFYFSHHITTIEGGMIVTNNKFLYNILKTMRAHGWTRDLDNSKYYEKKYPKIDPKYLFINSGFNLRSTELNAIIGLEQLKKLHFFNQKRNNISNIWSKAILNSESIITMQINKGIQPAWFGFPLIGKNKKITEQLKKKFNQESIEFRPIICGNMARQPAIKLYKHKIFGSLKNSNKIMNNGIYIGSSPLLSNYDINKIKVILENFK